ncbi:TetR/AcrR family transcriptional regulator [Tessaracoccus caeni]|uniref:TetR/AcrR family transcriptional regulator n=1 Tax=Tessaracoccus caeni TaxID=3031239 RepID=UPI0023DC66C3|nr:TetR/AcrR family transcriptional regulator [Tessaracoccus caeni]MDF1488411.1 TetR/AcrR family transcriptional regulator [Tessaracoccus caeni]
MVERTGSGDPLQSLALLWRTNVKTGRSGLTLDSIIDAGITVAGASGVEGLSMRKIAEQLGVSAMSLYAHVPSKAELIDLMVDHVNGEAYPEAEHRPPQSGWRAGVGAIAERNWQLLSEHRWLLDLDTARPPLGPGTTAKYDIELAPLVGIGLDDIETDQVLTLVLEHVKAAARLSSAVAETSRTTGSSDQEWWTVAGPVLSALIDPARFPNASRIGLAAGQEYNSAVDPNRTYIFGLRMILDGVEGLIAQKREAARDTVGRAH